MENDSGFDKLYEDLKSKYLQEVEDLRLEEQNIIKKNLRLNYTIFLSGVVLILLVLIITFFTNNSDDAIEYMQSNVMPLIGFVILGTVLAFAFIPRYKFGKADYRSEYKQKIVKAILEYFNENLEYSLRKGIDEADYLNADFENYDVYFSEDLITGKLKNGCQFSFAEVATRKRYEDLNGQRRTKDIFEGAFAKIETPKPFKAALYLRKDLKDKGVLEKISSLKLNFKDLRTEMDSDEFKQFFDVYCNDKIIAMQLLTADIMQLLVDFRKEMHKNFEITIKDDNIYIRFDEEFLFRVLNIETSTFDEQAIYRQYKILKFIFALTNNIVKLLKETEYDVKTSENSEI